MAQIAYFYLLSQVAVRVQECCTTISVPRPFALLRSYDSLSPVSALKRQHVVRDIMKVAAKYSEDSPRRW